MMNRYPGKCYWCGFNVPQNRGHFERRKGSWAVIHVACMHEQREMKKLAKDHGISLYEARQRFNVEVDKIIKTMSHHPDTGVPK